jgi:hypothetical protein
MKYICCDHIVCFGANEMDTFHWQAGYGGGAPVHVLFAVLQGHPGWQLPSVTVILCCAASGRLWGQHEIEAHSHRPDASSACSTLHLASTAQRPQHHASRLLVSVVARQRCWHVWEHRTSTGQHAVPTTMVAKHTYTPKQPLR